MNPLIYRQGKLFKIELQQLPVEARNSEVLAELYTALHCEFRGASENIKYAKMTYQQRMEAINQYASNWLVKKGYK